MKIYISRIVAVASIFLLVGLFSQFYTSSKHPSEDKTKPFLGNVNTLLTGYEQWKQIAKKNGADRNLFLRLGYSKALSFKFTNAHGTAKLDLASGSMSVFISGLPEKESFDVWLVDNKSAPKDSVKPEPWDKMLRVGGLKHKGETATLEARLDREALKGFKIDLIVVAISGKGPGEAGLIFGSPSLFQRLYYSEQRGQVAKLGFDTSPTKNLVDQTGLSFPFNFLVPTPALAAGVETPSMEDIIAEGERLFFNETFDGNGRTCGTCHPMENNLTLDKEFIATLPPRDPLFVAEFNPKLKNGFEKPALMREFGLIRENADGFDDLDNKFVMRGVPHTLALLTSLMQAQAADFPGNPAATDGQLLEALPAEMTGWSGDGAPGGGSLSDFATGAVTQHFTKSLNRIAGKDFRLPNDDELFAMEAFQLSLGRQQDPILAASITIGLQLTNAAATAGKTIFINGTGNAAAGGKCITCHINGGATQAGGRNRNSNSGVEDLPATPGTPKAFDSTIPRDGGFGRLNRSPAGCGNVPSPACGFGDSRFNTTPLIEAADTPPFFHNNSVKTIEDAVAFFNGAEFNNNPNTPGTAATGFFGPRAPGARIQLDSTQITQVASLLRVLNALENIRSAIQLSDNASSATNFGRAKRSLRVVLAELEDAIQVLGGGVNLHTDAVPDLERAAASIEDAIETSDMDDRNDLIMDAIDYANAARDFMCTRGSDPVLCDL